MTASAIALVGLLSVSTMQAPAQGTNDEIARAIQQAMQQAQAAREQALQQAQAAREQALQQAQSARDEALTQQRQAQQEAQNAQREAQREMERAQREIQRAVRDAQRAAREGQSGQPVMFPPFPGGGPQIPEGAVIMSVAFFIMCAVIAIGLPLARAFGRRMDKRSVAAAGADPDTRNRLERIEQAVDAIAVEVERISEGQRFTTRILSDLRALPQPDPSVAVPERGAVPISRAREAR